MSSKTSTNTSTHPCFDPRNDGVLENHLNIRDSKGKLLEVGQTVVYENSGSGIERTVTAFSPCGKFVRTDGGSNGFKGHCYTIIKEYVPKSCCTLQEAADLLEAEGIQVDRKQLERVLNPRPKTLPISKIRLRDTRTGDIYIVTAYDVQRYQAVCLSDHLRWNSGDKLSGTSSGVCLDELENSVVARNLTLLDTWSKDTEFPELLDKPELLES